jgi:hypothetical protein
MATNMNQQDDSTSHKVEEARDLLEEIKGRARQAHESGNSFMMNIYQKILKVSSPIVVKAVARAEREELAQINKNATELRQQVRANSSSE